MALVKGTNSHADLDDADAYFADRVDGEVWIEADVVKKEQCLISATSVFETLNFAGMAISDSQPLVFPRIGSYFDPRVGRVVNFDGTPNRILLATYEQAYHFLVNESLQDETGSVKSVDIGGIITLTDIKSAGRIPEAAYRFLKPLLASAGANAWWRAN